MRLILFLVAVTTHQALAAGNNQRERERERERETRPFSGYCLVRMRFEAVNGEVNLD